MYKGNINAQMGGWNNWMKMNEREQSMNLIFMDSGGGDTTQTYYATFVKNNYIYQRVGYL